MTAPTKIKAWEHSPNITISEGNIADRNKALMLELFKCLIGTGTYVDDSNGATSLSYPATVIASSDGATAGTPGPSWVDMGDIVWANAGSPHSWMHLRFPDFFGTSDPLDVLIDFVPAAGNGSIIYLGFCRDGYNSDGTVNDRPTAAGDEISILDGVTSSGGVGFSDCWSGSDGLGNLGQLQFQATDDGTCYRWFWFYNGVCTAGGGFQRTVDGPAGHADPYFAWYVSSDVTTEIMDFLDFRAVRVVGFIDGGGTERLGFFTHPMYLANTTVTGLGTDSIDGARGVFPMTVLCEVPVIFGGGVFDFWWARDADVTGDQAPSGTTSFMQVGGVMVPYPAGVVPLTS